MLEEHHVWGGALRKKSEEYGAKAYLCVKDHREGKRAVHKCREASEALKAKHQARIMEEQGWDTERFIAEFGRNYI
jgi:hypothetical protein